MATKLKQEKSSFDTWRTVYEGTSNACTIPIDSSFNRALRVLIVQRFSKTNEINNSQYLQDDEECISASSPIAIFSTTTSESPKKRAKINSNIKNHNCSKKCTKCSLPLKIEMPVRMTIGRRIKRFGISIKKFFTEKDCALILMVKF